MRPTEGVVRNTAVQLLCIFPMTNVEANSKTVCLILNVNSPADVAIEMPDVSN